MGKMRHLQVSTLNSQFEIVESDDVDVSSLKLHLADMLETTPDTEIVLVLEDTGLELQDCDSVSSLPEGVRLVCCVRSLSARPTYCRAGHLMQASLGDDCEPCRTDDMRVRGPCFEVCSTVP